MLKKYLYMFIPVFTTIIYSIFLRIIFPFFEFNIYFWLLIVTIGAIFLFSKIGKILIMKCKVNNHNYFCIPILFYLGYIIYYLGILLIDLYKIYILKYWESFSIYWIWGGQADFIFSLIIVNITIIPVSLILFINCIIIKKDK